MRYNNGMTNLTPKREAFCREYIIDCNGTQAAIRAGYSKKTARSCAADLLTLPNIQSRLATLRAAVTKSTVATYEQACERMTQIMNNGGDSDSIKACDRLAKLRGWDQPARLQTEDVTPPRYDLTALTDTELAAFEAALAKVQA